MATGCSSPSCSSVGQACAIIAWWFSPTCRVGSRFWSGSSRHNFNISWLLDCSALMYSCESTTGIVSTTILWWGLPEICSQKYMGSWIPTCPSMTIAVVGYRESGCIPTCIMFCLPACTQGAIFLAQEPLLSTPASRFSRGWASCYYCSPIWPSWGIRYTVFFIIH